MHSTTTPAYTDLSYPERDRLRAAFAAGFSTGSGVAWTIPRDPALAAIIEGVVDDYLISLELFETPLIRDNMPSWLLRLAREADSPQVLASLERETALGDAQPPASWMRQASEDGRP